MKVVSIILLAIIITFSVSSCKKDTFITSKNASLSLSSDTLYFDTVFTTTGSITGSFKIFNNNNQKLLLSNVQLMGGANSFFKLNLDGTPGTSFNNQTIAANDSLYGFVSVTISATNEDTFFIRRDSIRITYNGDTTWLQLVAYGHNANFIKTTEIKNDTTWTNKLPIVLLGDVTVDSGKTLTIQKGTNVYANAKASLIINGTLNAVGDTTNRITFRCDRLDAPYNGFPGSWPGIYFNASSANNFMQYCTILNGYNGVSVAGPAATSTPVLTLDKCIFSNIYNIAIGAGLSSINATNCLVSNCGSNINIIAGGTYTFDQCTVVSYDNSYVSHTNPVVSISNLDASNNQYALSCTFKNSILYGFGSLVTDEIVFAKTVTNTNVFFNNVLYKEKDDISAYVKFNNYCIYNQPPTFTNIDLGNLFFDFHLNTGVSNPPLKAGGNTNLLTDLDGRPRPATKPDLGCYQASK